MRFRSLQLTLAATAALATPAMAQGSPDPVTDAAGRVYGGPPAPPLPPMPSAAVPGADNRPEWRGHHQAPQQQGGYPQGGYGADYARQQADYGQQREDWLRECRRRHTSSGLGGAAVGGVIGGLAGSGIAGRGNRTTGAVVGAVVGAVAGAAVERGSSRGRAQDECEAWLAQYSQPAPGYAHGGYGQYGYAPQGYAGYAVPMMMVPVAQQGRQCKETVVTTYEYVDGPVRRRVIHRRPVVHDKRVRMVPDKRTAM